jgi:NADP-dependent 3-hydroxy acid dehydrogenase YdfG
MVSSVIASVHVADATLQRTASVWLCERNYRAVEVFTRQLGDRAVGRVTDASDERQVAAALRAARAAFGVLDIVVHCAGVGAMAPSAAAEIAAAAVSLASESCLPH